MREKRRSIERRGAGLLAAMALALGGCGQIVGLGWTPSGEGADDTTGAEGCTECSGTADTTGSGGGGAGSGGAGATTTSSAATTSSATGGPQVECAEDSDCPDDGNACTTRRCSDGACGSTPVKAGTPCGGGICDGAGTCVECVIGAQCASGVCTNHTCAAPSCHDDLTNGDETDLDCGGPDCPKCAENKKCADDEDCQSGDCDTKKGRCKDDD